MGAEEQEANQAEPLSISSAPSHRGSSTVVSPSAPLPLCTSAVSDHRSFRTATLGGLLLCVALAAQAADPFYLRLLRQGTDAYNRRDFAVAERQLRVACFGFLDEPELLAEGLVRLGLAQVSVGDTSGFTETFQRIAEIEERFGGYDKAQIPSDVRDAFQRSVLKVVPRVTLLAHPAIAGLIPGADGRGAKSAALSAAPRATPTPTRPAVASPSPTAAAPATPPVVATPLPTEAPTRPAAASPSPTAVAPATTPAVVASPLPTEAPTRWAVALPSRTAAAPAASPAAATPLPTQLPTRSAATSPGPGAAAPAAAPAAVASHTPSAAPPRSPVPTARGTAVTGAPTPSGTSSPTGTAPPRGSLTSPPPIVPALSAAATPPPRRVATGEEQRELDAIQELVRTGKVGDALARARHLADAQPDLAEAQLAAAELAYRTMRWPEAVAYFRRAGDPGDARPLLLFYEAVSLYETGNTEEAGAFLNRSLPKIRRTAYVEGYVQKILGPGAAAPGKS